jgi:hypothetical protein
LQTAITKRLGLQRNPDIVKAINAHFELLTGHKPAGHRWVTKEQYIR